MVDSKLIGYVKELVALDSSKEVSDVIISRKKEIEGILKDEGVIDEYGGFVWGHPLQNEFDEIAG